METYSAELKITTESTAFKVCEYYFKGKRHLGLIDQDNQVVGLIQNNYPLRAASQETARDLANKTRKVGVAYKGYEASGGAGMYDHYVVMDDAHKSTQKRVEIPINMAPAWSHCAH